MALLREIAAALAQPSERGGAGRAARGVRLRRVPPRAAGDHRRAAGRPRLRRRHADRRRQVDHLPDPGARAGRHDAGDLAADRAHEGSGRRDARGRAARDLPELDAGPRRAAAAHRSDWRRASTSSATRRPKGIEASVGRLLPGLRPAPDRRRRGPLHQPVGPRLPPRLPQPRRAEAALRRRPGAGADGHRDARGHRRHRRAARRWRARRSVRGSFFRPNLRLSAYRKGDGDGEPRAGKRGAGAKGVRARSCGWSARARAERDHLRLSRKACESLADVPAGARRARAPPITPAWSRRRATRVQDAFRARRDRRGGRDHRVRHGHRQVERPLRDPPRHAALDRELLPGGRPRRPRRRCPATACCSIRGPTCSRAIASPPELDADEAARQQRPDPPHAPPGGGGRVPPPPDRAPPRRGDGRVRDVVRRVRRLRRAGATAARAAADGGRARPRRRPRRRRRIATPEVEDLFARLKALRKQLAAERKRPRLRRVQRRDAAAHRRAAARVGRGAARDLRASAPPS